MNKTETDAIKPTRRNFLKGGSIAALMTMIGGVELFAQAAPESKTKAGPGSKVKVGIIGLGQWGREILDQLGRMDGAEIAAICDNYPPMLSRSATKAPGAARFADYHELLANKDVSAVIIATPTHQHKDIALAVLAAGKHVYCEAPLAGTVEDAKAIALAAKKSVTQIFQAGLQYRCDPQRHWLTPFVRSGALGNPIMGRGQWHKKQGWRFRSPNPDRDKTVNWRLQQATSTGLAGEIGIHQLDQAGWFFLDKQPIAITGFGSINFWKDGRDVADTIQLVVEYPDGVRLSYDATLANSFDREYEMYYGSDAALMLRDSKAWMFNEVDAPVLGWQPYCRKDNFYNENGIALIAGGSKQTAQGSSEVASAFEFSPLYYALETFVTNCAQTLAAIEDYTNMGFDVDNRQALGEYLVTSRHRTIPSDVDGAAKAKLNMLLNPPGFEAGYAATVLAIKANEAVIHGGRLELKPEWFELA